jgi:hypothetical protein
VNDTLELAPVAGKTYKFFLVEVDDDDRERVIAGQVSQIQIESEVNYGDIRVDDLLDSVRVFSDSVTYTLTANLVPSDDGTYFRIENFLEEEDDDEIRYEQPEEWDHYA